MGEALWILLIEREQYATKIEYFQKREETTSRRKDKRYQTDGPALLSYIRPLPIVNMVLPRIQTTVCITSSRCLILWCHTEVKGGLWETHNFQACLHGSENQERCSQPPLKARNIDPEIIRSPSLRKAMFAKHPITNCFFVYIRRPPDANLERNMKRST